MDGGRQPVVALSTAESEYISATSAAQEALWLKSLVESLGYPQGTIQLYEDNQACIALSKNPQDHKRTKHIQVRFHFLRDLVNDKVLELTYVPTKHQLADICTKALNEAVASVKLAEEATKQAQEATKQAQIMASMKLALQRMNQPEISGAGNEL